MEKKITLWEFEEIAKKITNTHFFGIRLRERSPCVFQLLCLLSCVKSYICLPSQWKQWESRPVSCLWWTLTISFQHSIAGAKNIHSCSHIVQPWCCFYYFWTFKSSVLYIMQNAPISISKEYTKFTFLILEMRKLCVQKSQVCVGTDPIPF